VGARRFLVPAGALLSACVLSSCAGSPPATHSAARPPVTASTTSTTLRPTPSSTTSIPAQPTRQLIDIAFFNARAGFGVFTQQTGACQDLVGATANGGATFGPLVPVAAWNCGQGDPAGVLAFDDHGDGFLFGPDLYVTHDSGATWAPSPQAGAVLAVQALGYSIWMVESSCPDGESPQASCVLRLFESDDGGRTWAAVSTPAGVTVNDGLASESAQGQTWLARTGPESAYLLSNPQANQQGAADSAPLWFTSDGGRTWSARRLPCAMDANSAVLSVAPDQTLLAVCAGQPSAGSQLKSAVRSSDGGVTWTVQSSCSVPASGTPVPACTSGPFTAGYLGQIDALSADTAFLVGSRSSLLETHDGGTTWQAVEPFIGDTSDGSIRVIFFNQLDGVVLGEDGNNDDRSTIWSTTDGGVSWFPTVPST
jgi:photosystem II stability/assembly factor-like uncharacterized protein